jgi:hypothetical protein
VASTALALVEPPLAGQGHRYGVGMVRRFCQFVLSAACSLRAASAVLGLLRDESSPRAPRPAANTGQMWLLQIGLHELQRPKAAAEDWVWLIDHAVQMGTIRCLLIVGCRLAAWRAAERPLEHEDLSVFALEPVEKSDGATVARQLEATTSATGIVPRAILCDQGSDLKNGLRTYCQAHPRAAVLHDIAHQTANEMKRELTADPRWMKFCIATGQAKQRLIMTPWAHLVPPKLRSKARYMNLQELVSWGQATLHYLDHPHPIGDQPLDRAGLTKKLGWLEEYRAALTEWGATMTVVSDTLTYIRSAGYHAQAVEELGPQLYPARSAMAQRVATRLLEFVARQSAAAGPQEHLPGSSEVLESLIGKGKRLEGQHSQSGFTKMILGVAAAVVRPTAEYLTTALATIKNQDVLDWCRRRLGISLTAQRRQALAPFTRTNTG